MSINDFFIKSILKVTGAKGLHQIEVIQSLWSGYGKIIRFGLTGCSLKTVIVKHVRFPDSGKHPRGWNTDVSHLRKIKSYEVEAAWYTNWSTATDNSCRLPKCYAVETLGEEVCIVLEDLDGVGFPIRKTNVTKVELYNCIEWLANFHATYLNEKPTNLWQIGTYWHLDTRRDELEVLDDIPLKNAASKIDQLLNESPYQTFVHGDAKLANFCFSKDGKVSAVDFQYVGGGCGMKDLVYFIGSCLYEDACEAQEETILSYYFSILKNVLESKNKHVDFDALEENWRRLYPVAWTDFHRFIKGWSPGHWKINSYSERLSQEVLKSIED
jgi:hypothetical protein